MQDFGFDAHVSGSLLSMDIGRHGRISQIWLSDPTNLDGGDDIPCVLPAISFAEENSEDYLPGTILIGARLTPDDPWVLSRSQAVVVQTQEEDADSDSEDDEIFLNGEQDTTVHISYEFPLLPELIGKGSLYESLDPVPHIVWDIELTNVGDETLELGELALPMALNNLYERLGPGSQGVEDLATGRFYLHKSINGSASYLHAQLTGTDPMGLLVVPGADTSWEFYTHVSGSIHSPFRWSGIPIIYVHSKAILEREGWDQWYNGHTSSLITPGNQLRFQVRFYPTSVFPENQVPNLLTLLNRPNITLWPGAVCPAHAGITVDVTGATPTQFIPDIPTHMETDADETGGNCFLQPEVPGACRLAIRDTAGRESYCHLVFIDPIEELIKRRADFIHQHQRATDLDSPLAYSYLIGDVESSEPISEPGSYEHPFAVQSILSEALFVAEANLIFPNEGQIAGLRDFYQKFFLRRLYNEATGLVGSVLPSQGVAVIPGNPIHQSLGAAFLQCVIKLQSRFGGFGEPDAIHEQGQRAAGACLSAMGTHSPTAIQKTLEVADLLLKNTPLAIFLSSIPDLNATGDLNILEFLAAKAGMYPNDHLKQEWFSKLARAQHNMAPSWWWYAGSSRFLGAREPHLWVPDKGELCIGPETLTHAEIALKLFENTAQELKDIEIRHAFGALLAPWALVREDGAASMGYCPDLGSENAGVASITGDISLTLWHYLRIAGCYVIVTSQGSYVFGCTYEQEEQQGMIVHRLQPWDGVGKRIFFRPHGLQVTATNAQIVSFSFGQNLDFAEIELKNNSFQQESAVVKISGLWGRHFQCEDEPLEFKHKCLLLNRTLNPGETRTFRITTRR